MLLIDEFRCCDEDCGGDEGGDFGESICWCRRFNDRGVGLEKPYWVGGHDIVS